MKMDSRDTRPVWGHLPSSLRMDGAEEGAQIPPQQAHWLLRMTDSACPLPTGRQVAYWARPAAQKLSQSTLTPVQSGPRVRAQFTGCATFTLCTGDTLTRSPVSLTLTPRRHHPQLRPQPRDPGASDYRPPASSRQYLRATAGTCTRVPARPRRGWPGWGAAPVPDEWRLGLAESARPRPRDPAGPAHA